MRERERGREEGKGASNGGCLCSEMRGEVYLERVSKVGI